MAESLRYNCLGLSFYTVHCTGFIQETVRKSGSQDDRMFAKVNNPVFRRKRFSRQTEGNYCVRAASFDKPAAKTQKASSTRGTPNRRGRICYFVSLSLLLSHAARMPAEENSLVPRSLCCSATVQFASISRSQHRNIPFGGIGRTTVLSRQSAVQLCPVQYGVLYFRTGLNVFDCFRQSGLPGLSA